MRGRLPKTGYFIVYQVCSKQGLVVRYQRLVIRDTSRPREVLLYNAKNCTFIPKMKEDVGDNTFALRRGVRCI